MRVHFRVPKNIIKSNEIMHICKLKNKHIYNSCLKLQEILTVFLFRNDPWKIHIKYGNKYIEYLLKVVPKHIW